MLKGGNTVSTEPFFLQSKHSQLSQLSFVEMFQASDNLHSPSLKPFQQAHVFLVLETPGLDEVFQVESHSDTLPSTYCSHFFCCKSRHCWLSRLQMYIASSYPIPLHQYSEVLLCGTLLNQITPGLH